MADITMLHNPRGSKSRRALEILTEHEVDVEVVRYLEENPTRADLEALMERLAISDPRLMTRTGEAAYRDLDLADAGPDELLDAMVAHPILIERPIAVRGDRAVIGRPPERVLDLLD
ncbi:MAG: arsenate reductase (glutaredoxin) [Acidimicrobiales bacterium]